MQTRVSMWSKIPKIANVVFENFPWGRIFVVPFPLGLVLSLSSRQQVKTSLFEWNYDHTLLKWYFFHQTPPFEQKKDVISWLFHDKLRVREWEHKKKVTTNFAPWANTYMYKKNPLVFTTCNLDNFGKHS